MYCKNCGNKLKKSHTFCDNCGYNVNTKDCTSSMKVSDKILEHTKILSILGIITCMYNTSGILLAIAGIYEEYQYKKITGKSTGYFIINIATMILFIVMFIVGVVLGLVMGFMEIKNDPENAIIGNFNCSNSRYSSVYSAKINISDDGEFTWSKYGESDSNYLKGEYKLHTKSNDDIYITMFPNEYVVYGKKVQIDGNDEYIMANISFEDNRKSFIFQSLSSNKIFYCKKVK